MKKIYKWIVFIVFLALSMHSNGQDKLVITDRAQIMNNTVETALGERLAADSLTLSNVIDNRKRCEYWFASLVIEKNNLLLSVTDCNDKVAGTRNMGSMVMSANDHEKAMLLYFAISEVIKNKYSQVERKSVATQEVTPTTDEDTLDPGSHHSSRYFFSPSSMNLKKGEFYYNTLYFFVHDVQYGASDQFSIGMGTTIVGFPFYITPKLSFRINERNSFAIGDMLMLGTWGTKFTGNLLYGTYTIGNYDNNFTAGGGYLALGGADLSDKINAGVVNFAGLARLSDHMFFISENYIAPFRTRASAVYYNYNSQNHTYQDLSIQQYFYRQAFIFYGLTGFRFVNKAKGLKSWQFGLSYIYSYFSKPPSAYSSPGWYMDNRGGAKLIAFPVVGYARKFSMN